MTDAKESRLANARTLMNKHGLHDWQIDFADLSRVPSRNLTSASFGANGICIFWDRKILIDHKVVPHRNKFLRVVLHEVAHALAGPLAGHGSRWLKIAKKVGCSRKSLSVYKMRLRISQ